jgi:aldehyde dehydrogenase (NAD(P)+)
MTTQSALSDVRFAPSARAKSAGDTPAAELDRAVAAVREKAREFARLPAKQKQALLGSVVPRISAVGRAWVDAACRAKGISATAPVSGEEWLGGPMTTARNARLLAESLAQIAEKGRPQLGRGVRTRPDGRLMVSVFPTSGLDGVLQRGFTADVLMEPGVDAAAASERQASFYRRKDPEGKVTVVLGAGNVSSIPPMDAMYKMFVDGHVCVVKMNPVNEWAGPFLEEAFAPLISRDYLRIVYGGGEVGAYLTEHKDVDDIHITGSDRTHDTIVWGPPGPERDRRRRENDPRLKKTITSELGNVSPVAVVPAAYTDEELWFQARNVASMVENNASFNCNAAKVLILAKGWAQRDRFLELLEKALGEAPPRKAFYPGARDRYEQLIGGRSGVKKFGAESEGVLAWALVRDVDASNADEALFKVEPFCGILSQTDIGSADPVEFLAEATRFCNERLWGTLNACLVIDPRSESDPAISAALDRAIVDLRYGSVTINHWPGVVYGTASAPWGGHPSATLLDVKSGIGWVHNTYMLEAIEKTVLRGPLVVSPKPAWFYDNAVCHLLGERMSEFEAAPTMWKVPGIAMAALRG